MSRKFKLFSSLPFKHPPPTLGPRFSSTQQLALSHAATLGPPLMQITKLIYVCLGPVGKSTGQMSRHASSLAWVN